MRQHVRHRRVFQGRQFRLVHHPQRQHIHHHQQRQHPNKAQHRGLAHIAAPLGTGRINTGALNTDKHPYRYQHHAFYLGHHTAQIRIAIAPEVGIENIHFERRTHQRDKGNQRHDFGHGGNQVDKRRLFNAAQHQPMHQP